MKNRGWSCFKIFFISLTAVNISVAQQITCEGTEEVVEVSAESGGVDDNSVVDARNIAKENAKKAVKKKAEDDKEQNAKKCASGCVSAGVEWSLTTKEPSVSPAKDENGNLRQGDETYVVNTTPDWFIAYKYTYPQKANGTSASDYDCNPRGSHCHTRRVNYPDYAIYNGSAKVNYKRKCVPESVGVAVLADMIASATDELEATGDETNLIDLGTGLDEIIQQFNFSEESSDDQEFQLKESPKL